MLYLQKHNNKIKKIVKLVVFLTSTYFIITNGISESVSKDELLNILLIFGILYIILDNYIPTY